MTVTYFKNLDSNLKSPLQGGDPLLNGKPMPVTLPKVKLDTGPDDCGPGWNTCRDIETTWKIAGMWRTGRPNKLIVVESESEWLERGNKLRTAGPLILVRYATVDEISDAIFRFSEVFGDHTERMAVSQAKWYEALSRPHFDAIKVEAHLHEALATRGLGWTTKRFDNAWAARDARAARDALTVEYAALKSWTKDSPDLLTTGLRDAYCQGMEIAIPTGPNELGYAMTAQP